MSKTIAGADDKALEGVVRVQLGVGVEVALESARRGEADLAQRRVGLGQGFGDKRAVAALGPGADALWSGEEEGLALDTGGLQRLQPEAVGGLRNGGLKAALGRPPEGLELVSGGVIGHRAATIAPCLTGQPGCLANPVEKIFAAVRILRRDEAHLPAKEAEAGEDARFPRPHEHPRRPGSPRTPPAQRSQAPHPLTEMPHAVARPGL